MSQGSVPRVIIVMFAAVLSVFVAASATAQSEGSPSEYEVKAAYLFNFLKFVEWPDDSFATPQSPIVIGVLGADPFGNALPEVADGKLVQGRKLVIRRYSGSDDPRAAHILFISASEHKRFPQIVAQLRGSSVLTVGDSNGFLEAGGMVQFVYHDDRIRFAINADAAGQAHLKISSKLLSLATEVVGMRGAAR